MTQVLIASDATERSDGVVAAGIAFAKRLDASTTVIHVVTEQRSEDLRRSLGSEDAFTDSVMKLLNDSLTEQVARSAGDAATAPGVVVSAVVVSGDIGETVLEHAGSMGADYLVIGIRNRSRVGKFLMGSDVQQILLSTPCPVLGIPI